MSKCTHTHMLVLCSGKNNKRIDTDIICVSLDPSKVKDRLLTIVENFRNKRSGDYRIINDGEDHLLVATREFNDTLTFSYHIEQVPLI
jgi:hypothetical protein